MTTLYVHPAGDYDERSNYSRKGHHVLQPHILNHSQSPGYQEARHHRHRHHQRPGQHPQSRRRVHQDVSASASPSPSSSKSGNSVSQAPPTLFFPVDEDEKRNATKPVSKSAAAPVPAKQEAASPSSDASGFTMLQSFPPLSALTHNDGNVLLNLNEDLSHFNSLSIQDIQTELRTQRVKNENLLIKLHDDHKKFIKVCKHYEKKKVKLQAKVDAVAESSANRLHSANVMIKLLNKRDEQLKLNRKQHAKCQASRAALWKSTNANVQLLSEVNGLNKQIDAYYVLIAKKNQECAGIQAKADKGKKRNPSKLAKLPKLPEEEAGDASGDTPDQSMEFPSASPSMLNCSTGTFNCSPAPAGEVEDPTASYAEQLIARNKRYNEILALLRGKVDELRACRKNI